MKFNKNNGRHSSGDIVAIGKRKANLKKEDEKETYEKNFCITSSIFNTT